MKQTILAVLMVLGTLVSSAQTKVGYINTTELIALMPETDSALKVLKKVEAQWKQEIQMMQQTFQTKYSEYVTLKSTDGVIPARLQIREQELQELQEKIELTSNYAAQDYADQQQKLYEPIIAKIKAAIQRVAKAQGYDIILDSSEGYNVLYVNPDHDLMAAVRVELKIPANAVPIDLTQFSEN